MMSKGKSKKKKNAKAPVKKEETRATSRNGIIIICAVAVLFIAFIVLIAVSGSKKGNEPKVSTTEYNEEAVLEAVENFQV